jgi:hypothetical protein
MLIGSVLILVCVGFTGCVTLEQRCMRDANLNAEPEMRSEYFHSCVETRRQFARNWSAAWANKAQPQNYSTPVNCQSYTNGALTQTTCQ